MKNQTQVSVYQRPAVVAGLALLCCALWGSAFPCIKIGYGLLNIEDAGSQILFGGYRFMLAGLLTLAFVCVKKGSLIRVERRLIPYLIAQGLIQTALQYILYYIGVAHTTGSKGAVINASNTFFSIFFAHFLMKDEKLTLRKLFGCIVGFAGILIMNMGADPNGGSLTLHGEGFVLLSSLAYGLSSVTLKLLSRREDTTVITALQFIFGSAVMIVLGLAMGGRVTGFSVGSVLLLLYLSLLSAAAFTLWGLLLKNNPVGRVAIYGFSIPVFGMFFSALLLHESVLSLKNLAALLLVCGGIVIVNSISHRSRTAADSGGDRE